MIMIYTCSIPINNSKWYKEHICVNFVNFSLHSIWLDSILWCHFGKRSWQEYHLHFWSLSLARLAPTSFLSWFEVPQSAIFSEAAALNPTPVTRRGIAALPNAQCSPHVSLGAGVGGVNWLYPWKSQLCIFLFFSSDAFDNELVMQTLKQILQGKTVQIPVYDFVTHSRWALLLSLTVADWSAHTLNL